MCFYENGSIWEKCVGHFEFSLVEGLDVVNVCLSWFNKDNIFESNTVLFFFLFGLILMLMRNEPCVELVLFRRVRGL